MRELSDFISSGRLSIRDHLVCYFKVTTILQVLFQRGRGPKSIKRYLKMLIQGSLIKIDAVNGVVETKRPDRKNADYQVTFSLNRKIETFNFKLR